MENNLLTTIVSIVFQNRPCFTRLTLYSVVFSSPGGQQTIVVSGGHGVCIPTKTHWPRRTAAAKRAPGHLSLPAPHFSSPESDGVYICARGNGRRYARKNRRRPRSPSCATAHQHLPCSGFATRGKKIKVIKFNIYIYVYVYA